MQQSSPDSTAQAPAPEGWRGFIAYLTPARVGLTIALGALAAAALNPIFYVPFAVLLGRTMFVAILALLAFSAAAQWPRRLPRWLARWLLQVLVVVASVPVGTLIVYLVAVGGDLGRLLQSEGRIQGFLWISGSGLLLGPLLAMGALYRQRDAEARSLLLRLELERSELERSALDTRLRLLQAQIEPHFLFNTLANIRALVETGSPQAASVLHSLIAYLRAAMPRLQDEGATLGDEIDLVQAYLELMHLRMPDRLRYRIEIPEALRSHRFPPMALLTLVENAVRHGIDPSEEGGEIVVSASRGGQDMTVAVADTGVGLSPTSGTGTGLRNLRERLKLFFGTQARLELSENRPSGLLAQIVFGL